jgi:hypothetical protein
MYSLCRIVLGSFLIGVLGACAPDSTDPSASAVYALRRLGDQLLPASITPTRQAPRYVGDTLLLSPSPSRGESFTVYRITVLETLRGQRSRRITRLQATRRDNHLSLTTCPEDGPCPPATRAASPFWFVGDLLFEEVPPGSHTPPRVYARVRD